MFDDLRLMGTVGEEHEIQTRYIYNHDLAPQRLKLGST